MKGWLKKNQPDNQQKTGGKRDKGIARRSMEGGKKKSYPTKNSRRVEGGRRTGMPISAQKEFGKNMGGGRG